MTETTPNSSNTAATTSASTTTATTGDDETSSSSILNINVGVLGHVDSGKTSLVKALSTLLSTAALDKSKQSRQRGMTLDLGFSCFFIETVPQHLRDKYPDVSQIQITLVDCPGHASLIRTIIGGAQIIDIVLLVVDAYKGWQAQTTECLVLAELTCSSNLIVALNKADMFPPDEREARLAVVKQQVREQLSMNNKQRQHRFINAPLVGVAACVGGEKVAAVNADEASAATGGAVTTTTTTTATSTQETYNMDVLVKTLIDNLPSPRRDYTSAANTKFYFSIDHCFPIRGRGTVMTGTCLAGSAKVNEMIEFPDLKQQRKIKSIQMFKRSCQVIRQGDRAGICVSNLDAGLIERGIAASPQAVTLLRGAIALVKKIPYYTAGRLKCHSKFHISVGHTTVMANVTFFGARELWEARMATKTTANSSSSSTDPNNSIMQDTTNTATTLSSNKGSAGNNSSNDNDKTYVGSVALGGDATNAGLPSIPYDASIDYRQQDELFESLETNNNIKDDDDATQNKKKKKESTALLLHWALLEFQTPIYCPLHSLIIGSRLDTTIEATTATSATATTTTPATNKRNVDAAIASSATAAVTSCRLAFSGRLIEKIDPSVKDEIRKKVRLYTMKERRGVVCRLGDPHRRQDDEAVVRYEIFGQDLFKKETNMQVFIGMKVMIIPSSAPQHQRQKGNNNKQQSKSPTQHQKEDNDNNDQTQTSQQYDVGEIKSSFGTAGKFRMSFPAGTQAREGDEIVLQFQRFAQDPDKRMHQNHIQLPASRPGSRLDVDPAETNKKKNKNKNKNKQKQQQQQPQHAAKTPPTTPTKSDTGKSSNESVPAGSSSSLPSGVHTSGQVVSVKTETNIAIVSGLFSPEINIREFVAKTTCRVILIVPDKGKDDDSEKSKHVGSIVGPFGKAGKCKVSFDSNNGVATNNDDSNTDDQDRGTDAFSLSEQMIGSQVELKLG